MNYPYYTNMASTVVSIEDAELLKSIALHPNLTQYVRIHILAMNETEEVGLIQGRVTSGNISLNSSSPVRRSGSLSLVADQNNCDITNIANIISINKRAKIEIGIENQGFSYTKVDEDETQSIAIEAIDNKIWFKLGTFVLTNASLNKSLSGFTMSVNLKDKMALLNGECGGTIYSMVTHSPIYTVDGKEEKVPFEALITKLVSYWGNIPTDKIKVHDISQYTNNTYTWHGSVPLYIQTPQSGDIKVTLTKMTGNDIDTFTSGQAVCYTLKQQVYPTELTSSVGESVTSVLDKIKKTLGNYEYFFDIDGNFIFQQIQNGLNEGSALDNLAEAFNDAYFAKPSQENKSVFSFEDTLLISCSNQPKYESIKNDYVVWGAKGTSKTPIRYHLAIDTKPDITQIDGYDENDKHIKKENVQCYQDSFGYWRIVPQGQQKADSQAKTVILNDWRSWLYYDYVVNGNDSGYGQELQTEFPKQYNLLTGLYCFQRQNEDQSVIEVSAALYDLVYWLDLLDPNELSDAVVKAAITNMTVNNIGRRTKTLKDDVVNCIFNIRPLDILLLPTEADDLADMRAAAGTTPYCQIGPDISRKMSNGNWNCSAYDTIRAVLHETTAYNNTISLTTIPVFHLEPNMRIKVLVKEDSKSIIDGEYMINSMSIPLAYNGNMTISASRAIERI